MVSRKLSICCCKPLPPPAEAVAGGAGRRWIASRKPSICRCRLTLTVSLMAGTTTDVTAASAAASVANVTSRRRDRDVGSSVLVPPRAGLPLRDEPAERLPSPPVLGCVTLVDRRGLPGGLRRDEAAEAEALLRALRGLTGGVEVTLDAGLAERCERPSAEAERLQEAWRVADVAGALRGLAGGVDEDLNVWDDAARVDVESLVERALDRPAAAVV